MFSLESDLKEGIGISEMDDGWGLLSLGDLSDLFRQIGKGAENTNQGTGSIAIGNWSGIGQGSHAIAIGEFAGQAQHDNSIVINAQNSVLTSNGTNRFFVKTIRNSTATNTLFYNDSTGEITYMLLPKNIKKIFKIYKKMLKN